MTTSTVKFKFTISFTVAEEDIFWWMRYNHLGDNCFSSYF